MTIGRGGGVDINIPSVWRLRRLVSTLSESSTPVGLLLVLLGSISFGLRWVLLPFWLESPRSLSDHGKIHVAEIYVVLIIT